MWLLRRSHQQRQVLRMGDLVVLDMVKRKRDERADELWEEYRRAAKKAQSTLDIDDGVAAGRAWRAWLDQFRAVQA